MFNDEKIGLLLLITHFLASLTVGFLFRFYKKHSTSDIIPQVSIKSTNINISNIGLSMGEAIQKSISTLLLIGGYIVFFAVLNEILSHTILKNVNNNLILGILNGILEITSGIKKISSIKGISSSVILPIVALLLGFGGFSVHMQVASIISESKLSIKIYLLGKFLQGIFAAIYTYAILNFTSFFCFDVVEAFNYSNSSIPIIDESFGLFRTISTLFFVSIITAIIFNLSKLKIHKRY